MKDTVLFGLGFAFLAVLLLAWFVLIMPLTLVERAWKDSMG